jgi:release factor glutamine methyltransferase
VTIQAAKANARRRLEQAGIPDAGLEAEVLLRHVLGFDRTQLFQRLQDHLDPEASARFEMLIARRLEHEPLAYITGHREFYRLDFEVSPATLIPRPETETLVQVALEMAQRLPEDATPVIADVGTGSGAIAVALAHALPRARIYATDLSSAALAVAGRNAERLGVRDRVLFRAGDLLEPVDEPLDIIVANLPYVTTGDWQALPPELHDHEPRSALDGGADGLDVIRRLLQQAPAHLKPAGAICLEFGADQAQPLVVMARQHFPGAQVSCRQDLAGRPRVITIYTL